METLRQDLAYGLRLLRRFPGITAAALVALALGTGVNTALFSIVNTVLLTPLPFPDAQALVQVWRTELPRLQYGSASVPRYVDWRAQNQAFTDMGAFAPGGLTLSGRDAPERVAGARATASFFATVAATPLLGRYFTEADEQPGAPPVVVLGEGFWIRRFARDAAIVGTTLTLNDTPHTVVGIAPRAYGDMWRVEAWIPLPHRVDPAARGNNFLVVVARQRPELSDDGVETRLAELATAMSRSNPDDRYGFFTMRLHDILTQGPRQALWILLAATAIVVLIACANVANLLLVRGVTRRREMALRTAMGAGRLRLVRQLITEAMLLSLTGAALGLGLAGLLLRVFTLVAPANFPRLDAIALDRRVLLFSLGLAAVTGVLAAVLPAWLTSQAQPADALRDSSRGATAGRARTTTQLLVVVEVAMAVMLVAAAGLTLVSLQRLTQQDLGLVTRHVLTFSVGLIDSGSSSAEVDRRFFATLEQRVAALPGVDAAGAISMLPIAQTGTNGPVTLPDRVVRPEESPLAEYRVVTPGYFAAVGITAVAGRFPDARDHANAPPIVVINETLARALWPGEPPARAIGRQIGLGFDSGIPFREIVGVTRDVRSRRPDLPADGETYVPLGQARPGSMAFTVRSGIDPTTLVPSIRRELGALDSRLPMAAVRTLDDVVSGATRSSRLYSALTAVFALLAAVLAVIGIYSVMAYSVAARARELAVRAALGASRRGLLHLVLREGFLLSAAGIVLGLAGAVGLSRLVQALLYQVSPTDPVVLGATCGLVALAALGGYVIPAIRASRVHPASALTSAE